MVNAFFRIFLLNRLKSYVKFGHPPFCLHKSESLTTEVHMKGVLFLKTKNVGKKAEKRYFNAPTESEHTNGILTKNLTSTNTLLRVTVKFSMFNFPQALYIRF